LARVWLTRNRVEFFFSLGAMMDIIVIVTLFVPLTVQNFAFVRLAQRIFRPNKVGYTCPCCGLNRHDPDAVHCKLCGVVLNIETEGG